MHSLWNFFLHRRQFTILIIALITLLGISSALRITKESSPEIQIPIGVVSVVLPGASTADIERLVTNKLESRLSNLQNLSKLTSVSREGVAVVTAEFNASANLDKSIQKLKDEVDKAKIDLPSDAKEPNVTDVNFADQPIQIVSVSTDMPFAELANFAEELKRELETVQGISKVAIEGVRHREISVVVKKEEMARLGISLNQIIALVGATNVSLPVGSIISNDISYSIGFRGSLDAVKDIGGVAIGSVSGRVIYLRDIADVSDGIEKASTYSRISSSGKPSEQAITLAIFKSRGSDVAKATKGVRAKLDALKSSLLRDSTVLITNDAGDRVQKDLSELSRTGLETMLLVMLVLFATIGWRESIVAGLSIPLSFLMAFTALQYTGNTINFISLFSLILAIGILVDSGIVVVEAIHTRIKLYGDKEKAALDAINEYSWPLIGGTMTTVAVFFPLFFISGIVGKFIASIPYTLIFVLVASIFVALGLVPSLTILFSSHGKETKFTHMQEEYAEKARTWYAGFLRRFLHNRRQQNLFMLGMILAFFFVLFLPALGLLKVTFFPQDDSPFLYVDIETQQGTDINKTDLAARAVEEALYGDSRIESMITTVGASSAFAAVSSEQHDGRYANVTVNLVDKKLRKENSTTILEDVKKKLKNISLATIRAAQPTGGPPVGAPVTINFLGSDSDVLDTAVLNAISALKRTPGATDVDSSSKNDGSEFSLSIDRAKLASVGLTAAEVAQALRASVSGVTATKLTGGTTDVNVVVTLNLNPDFTDPHDASRANIDAIREIPLVNSKGTEVLLGSVVKASLTRSNAMIQHQNRQRIVTLTSNVAPGYTVKDVLAGFAKEMKATPLPNGVTQKIGGEDEQTNQSFGEMGLAFLAGLGLMYTILVLSFNSFRHPFYLIGMVILSLIGVFGGLTITGQPLSFSSLLGVIALAGVIINHAIILTDAILRRLHSGEKRNLSDVIVEAAVSRLRPIVLTTVTTVVGMIPLTYASALWGPLAFAILFGLSFAMLLTLIFIPTLVFRWPGKLPQEIAHQ